MCNVQTSPLTNTDKCFTPDPSTFKFQDNWKLNGGAGEIAFKGRGTELIIQMRNQISDTTYQYWIHINAYSGTRSRITRDDGYEVCYPTHSNPMNLNVYHDFKIILDPSTKKITVNVDGKEYFSCTDNKVWNTPALYYGISRYAPGKFHICNVGPAAVPLPPSFNLNGRLLNATTGQKISPLNGSLVTITDNATKVTYNGQINVTDSSYTAKVPAGEYTISGVVTGFISDTTFTRVKKKRRYRYRYYLSSSSTDNKTRVVLTWVLAVPRPVDLDLYVININNTNEKVFHSIKRSPSGQLVLDVDNLQSGPETVTIRQDATDNFQIVVRSYNKVNPITISGAVVDIYRGNNLVKSIPVPNIQGEKAPGWDVGFYNARDGTLTLNNKLIK
jgi:stress response protein SCP2